MPAILVGIGAIVQKVLEASIVGAEIGALFGGAIGAGTEAVSGVQEHGQVNRDVLDNVAQAAITGGKDGALVGGVFGGVGAAAGPVTGSFAHIVDDIAGPAGRALGGAGAAAKTVGRAISATTPYRVGRALFAARYYSKQQLKTLCNLDCVYIMDDAANAVSKIGVSKDPATRLAAVQNTVGSRLILVGASPVDDAFAVESQLHRLFAHKNVPHPNHATGTEWFRDLSPADVVTIFSQ